MEERRRRSGDPAIDPERDHVERPEIAERCSGDRTPLDGVDLRPVVREERHPEARQRGESGHERRSPWGALEDDRVEAAC